MKTHSRHRFARLHRAAGIFILALFPVWAFGQIARDATMLTGLCFYVPSAGLAAAVLILSVLQAAARRPRPALWAGALALPPLAVAVLAENHPLDPPPSAARRADLRLVHWNVGGSLGHPGARKLLAGLGADAYVLAEIPDAGAVENLRAELGDGFRADVFGNLAVVARGEVRSDGWLIDRRRTKSRSVTWRHAEWTVAVMVVDLPSEPWVHRDPLLREVNELIAGHGPDLVVGDFNAPRRSRALEELPAGYRHAYDSAGRGLGYTWPVPFPVYAIDQCIHGPRVAPVSYELMSSWHSDHRCQVFDFALLDE